MTTALGETTIMVWNIYLTMLRVVGKHIQIRLDGSTFTSQLRQIKRKLLLRCIDN
jgi:hypothetical protein